MFLLGTGAVAFGPACLPKSNDSALARAQDRGLEPQKIIPFVPTPQDVVDRMLEVAQVNQGDVVYDLGSGDGTIVITAAKQ